MWIIALEALIALGLLLLVVWLTMSSARRRDAAEPPKIESERAKDPDAER